MGVSIDLRETTICERKMTRMLIFSLWYFLITSAQLQNNLFSFFVLVEKDVIHNNALPQMLSFSLYSVKKSNSGFALFGFLFLRIFLGSEISLVFIFVSVT